MPPNHFESEVESFLEGSHGDRTHIKRADHHTVTPLCGTLLTTAGPRKNSPSTPPPAAFPRKNSPSTPQNADFGPFFVRRANFFALAPTPGQAGRTFSRTGHGHVPTLKPMTPLQPLMQASMKPPAPLLAPKQRPLKPATPLQPKNAPNTPISHPQRRHRFQESGPPGLQDPDAIPVAGGRACP